MSSPMTAVVQRQCAAYEDEEKDLIQKTTAAAASAAETIHEAARLGTGGASGRLPHLGAIQRSFGAHDLSGVAAHTDGAAAAGARAIGAAAYTIGSHVAFASPPSLWTAAHEAAHVIQQRGGVRLPGGIGQAGDRHEQHADAVADRVVAGQSSEPLLLTYVGAPSRPQVQQQKASGQEQASQNWRRFREEPVVVAQKSTWTCWAAALESWAFMTPNSGSVMQQDLIDEFATDERGGLDPERGWPRIASALQIQYRLVESDQDLAFLWRLVFSKLKSGHVIIVYKLPGGAAHANVVYGVEPAGNGDFVFSVMDPQGKGSTEQRSLSFYKAHRPLIVGWPGMQF
jgi:hypothetical protein